MVACMRTGTRLTAGYRYTTLKDTTKGSSGSRVHQRVLTGLGVADK